MSLENEVNALLEKAAEDKRVPGITAIALDKLGNVLYKGAYGSVSDVNDTQSKRMTPSTPILAWSLTKLVVSIAALQLLESGQLGSLDDPVEKYVPSYAEIQVLEGWTAAEGDNDDAEPICRAPKTKATIRHLLTHTSGSAYDFLDGNVKRWFEWRERRQGIKRTGRKVSDVTPPFSFDAGTAWTYGWNLEWMAWVIEAITGQTIDEYLQEHVLRPLGLSKTGGDWSVTAETVIHFRLPDGTLIVPPPQPKDESPEDDAPLQSWGGHYLTTTAEEYAQILLAVLNGGTHPTLHAQILKPETVQQYLLTDQLPQILGDGFHDVANIKTTNPFVANDGELLPGVRKGWTAGLMYNIDDVPGGRKAGSGAWAGISNHYYWVDPTSGRLGLLMTSVVPFMDKEVLDVFDRFEKIVYKYAQ